jgi:hypothetical protein
MDSIFKLSLFPGLWVIVNLSYIFPTPQKILLSLVLAFSLLEYPYQKEREREREKEKGVEGRGAGRETVSQAIAI